MPTSAGELLRVSGLSTGYGKVIVLRDVNLSIAAGEIVALLGPNGAGKTTMLRAVSGLLPWSGSVRFAGRDLAGAGPRDAVQAGLVHVIEGHRVFTQLTVADNLLLAAYDLPRGERANRVEEAFVVDEIRKAGFVLDAEGSFLRNAADPRDVTSNQPKIPTDKFALRFVKPR